jgi:ABC-type amino acid transport substrate-binding protein
MDAQISFSELPSMGSILEKLSKGRIDATEFDDAYLARLKAEIY